MVTGCLLHAGDIKVTFGKKKHILNDISGQIRTPPLMELLHQVKVSGVLSISHNYQASSNPKQELPSYPG